jgi:unsaturated rhamnogalacturonyl hydrolase
MNSIKKTSLIACACFMSIACLATNEKDSDLAVCCAVADNLIRNNVCQLVDASGGFYKINNRAAEWRYENGVTYLGMMRLYDSTQDVRYLNYVDKQLNFFFGNRQLFEKQRAKGFKNDGIDGFLDTRSLDNCGAMTAAIINAYGYSRNKDWENYINHTANYIENVQSRLDNKMFCRGKQPQRTVWLDDLFMSVSFLANMGALSGNMKYFDDATTQVKAFTQLLFDEDTHLCHHCYYPDDNETGVAFWGRANGWSLLAQTTLLNLLPKDYPQRNLLISILRKSIRGIAEYQSADGMWHQLLNKSDSYEETSCTAMFTYAVAKAINEGWIDRSFTSIAKAGWQGIKKYIDENGNVKNTCIGTGIDRSITFYYHRPTRQNDEHGLGPVLMAGIEMAKLNNTKF